MALVATNIRHGTILIIAPEARSAELRDYFSQTCSELGGRLFVTGSERNPVDIGQMLIGSGALTYPDAPKSAISERNRAFFWGVARGYVEMNFGASFPEARDLRLFRLKYMTDMKVRPDPPKIHDAPKAFHTTFVFG